MWLKAELCFSGTVGDVEVRLSARETGLLLSRREGGTLKADPRRGLAVVMVSSGAALGDVFSFLRS